MSVINKMLQDLDRRHSATDAGADMAARVRPVAERAGSRERFWRTLAMLLLAAGAVVAWLAWEILPPRDLATPRAFSGADSARQAADGAAPAAGPGGAKPLKLARSIEGPVSEARPVAVAASSGVPAAAAQKEEPAPRVPAAAPALSPATAIPAAEPSSPPPTATALAAGADRAVEQATRPRPVAPPASSASRVVKRDREASPAERAEAAFRRAATLLNQARISEAEEELASALQLDLAHEPARQALVAIYLERGRLDDARRLLQEGVALNPAQTAFSVALARILIERRENQAALEVTQRASGAAPSDPDILGLRATALQRLGRHDDAIEAFQGALRARPTAAATWVALGVSLESAGRRADAAEAFRRSLRAGTLAVELREFAEQRVRALQ